MVSSFTATRPPRSEIHPDVFSMDIRHIDYNGYVEISWRSRLFGVSGGVSLRNRWGNASDVRDLAQYIERLVGQPLRNFAECGCRDPEMVRPLLPHFERQIAIRMEQLERNKRFQTDMSDALMYGTSAPHIYYPRLDLGGPKIDSKAIKKARELLVSQLNKAQRESFEKTKSFEVAGKDGKTYRISSERSFNVKGPDGVKYCGQTVDTPIEDQMLAQKLLLEHDPAKFFKNANKMGGGGTAQGMEMMMQEGARRIGMWRNGAEPWVW